MARILEIPNSIESEMMVLGCMLNGAAALQLGAKVLGVFDFYDPRHKTIYHILKSLHDDNKPADIHLVCEELKHLDRLSSIGGPGYVVSLAQYAGTSAYVEEYIEALKQHSNRRRLLDLSFEIKRLATEEENSEKILLDIQEHLKLIEKNKSAKDKFPIQFISQFDHNFLLTDPQKKPMLLEYHREGGKTRQGFLPKGIVAMLVGAGGVGKTTLLSQLAIAIATGTPFLNAFNPTDPQGDPHSGNVFLGLGENQYDDIHRILHKASKRLRHTQNLLDSTLFEASKRIAPFSFSGQQASFIENNRPSLYFRELKMRLEDTAPSDGWDLLIFDPISRIMGADAETDNASATQFIALMEELSIDLPGNPTVLLAHHVNKSALGQGVDQTQAASRGSSALTDGVRWQCNYTADTSKEAGEGVGILKMTKSNFTAITPEIRTKKDTDGFIDILKDKKSIFG